MAGGLLGQEERADIKVGLPNSCFLDMVVSSHWETPI